jgi:hypothetical protein
MTENEAKKKWCPAFRGNDHGFNRPLDLDTNALMGRCIASDCMAWRTAQIGRVLPGDEYKTFREEGYCGLAGTPQ